MKEVDEPNEGREGKGEEEEEEGYCSALGVDVMNDVSSLNKLNGGGGARVRVWVRVGGGGVTGAGV